MSTQNKIHLKGCCSVSTVTQCGGIFDYLGDSPEISTCHEVIYYIPITDVPFELHVVWPSDT